VRFQGPALDGRTIPESCAVRRVKIIEGRIKGKHKKRDKTYPDVALDGRAKGEKGGRLNSVKSRPGKIHRFQRFRRDEGDKDRVGEIKTTRIEISDENDRGPVVLYLIALKKRSDLKNEERSGKSHQRKRTIKITGTLVISTKVLSQKSEDGKQENK